MVNNNSLGIDIDSYDVLFHNLYRIYDENYTDYLKSLNNDLNIDVNGDYVTGKTLSSLNIVKNSTSNYIIELPLFNLSNILSTYIKDELMIRIYFKKSIILKSNDNTFVNVNDSDLYLNNLKLYMRTEEISNDKQYYIMKQPKINNLFCKRIMNRYITNVVNNGFVNFVTLSNFSSLASGCFIWLSDTTDNNNFSNGSTVLPYLFKYSIYDVEI
jgi:hypothetical protein